MELGRCLHCGTPLDSRRKTYCTSAHKLRAFRRRRAGAEQDAFPEGARKCRLKWRGQQRASAVLAARPR
jgi:hypothetical protein